jgi:hypothetical protein
LTLYKKKIIYQKVKLFAKIQWTRFAQTLHEKAKKKRDGANAIQFDFRGLMSTELNLLCDQNTLNEFSTLLRHEVLNVEHYCLITELIKGIRTAVIGHLYN